MIRCAIETTEKAVPAFFAKWLRMSCAAAGLVLLVGTVRPVMAYGDPTVDPELRIEITNLIEEPPGGWQPGALIKLGVTVCNNAFSDAFSDGLCAGSTPWPNPSVAENIQAGLLLPTRLTFAGDVTCVLDTDSDGLFDDGACPGGSFSIDAFAAPLLVLTYPDVPVGQRARIGFSSTLAQGSIEMLNVSAEISRSATADADATADNCDLAAGAPGFPEDDCDKIVFQSLPVELTFFDAGLEGTAALLQWQTASETNNAGFEIHSRSGGPDSEKGDWDVLGFVAGAGTTAEVQSYRFTVADLEPGRHVFRLKQIDYDGTFDYSPEVEVTVAVPETFFVASVYPNPFNPQATLQFAVRRSQAVTATVYNMLGQRVLELYRGVPTAGVTQTVQIDGSRLVTGTYVVQIVGEQVVATQMITLVK